MFVGGVLILFEAVTGVVSVTFLPQRLYAAWIL